MRIAATTLLSLLLTCSGYPQQRSTSPGRVSGFVSRVALLEAEQPNIAGPITTKIVAHDRNTATTHLSSAASAHTVLRFLLRSNTRYELQAALLDASPSLAITASVQSAVPTGSGVKAGAAELMKTITQHVPLSRTQSTLASGPRVSAAGSATSPSNAIEIEVGIEAGAESEWWAEIRFSLKAM